ncbi:oligosaccharide flippase family protein [Xylanibacter oryzae]|uniref:oligosaccharide flippase family protein n=1 Tax=Xylanibacter oryzae TaxID=185293 RepID=UPI0004B506A8|nr:oligosaccharide flippase family protein [Xylanibacter oryzae]
MKDTGSSYNHILKYTSAFGGIEGLNILIGLVRNKLVALMLGPEGMGLIALFNSTIKFLSDSTNCGIPMSAVRNISSAYEEGDLDYLKDTISKVRTFSILVAVAGMLLCIVLSPVLSKVVFSSGNHTLHFVILSPIIAMMTVTGGEIAILKGVRQLSKLAKVQVITVILALIISVPLYYYYGQKGIVPSLLLMSFASMLVTIMYSYKLYHVKINFSKKIIYNDNGMLKLGFAFVIVGILGSGTDLVIRSFINQTSSLTMVGLYNAGHMITMTYAGMVFSAMETDYFPRLSAIGNDMKQQNLVVNRQIEVSLLIISPMLVFFMIALPVILPLLYSGKFLPVMGMIQIVIIAMYFRAIKLPIEYLPLAKGDSKTYLFLESVYDIVVVILVILGFSLFRLTGAGFALTISGFIEFVMLIAFARYKYKYKMTESVVLYALMQITIGLLAYAVTYIANPVYYSILGTLLFIISSVISLRILHRKTKLWTKLKHKFNSL